jgi:hypothetical protein
MSYDLSSHTSLEAACRQYRIYDDNPVEFTLDGARSYCRLKGIQDPELKETLSKVGAEYERTQHNTFFNFTHRFTPAEKRESNGINDDLVNDIFKFANTAVTAQTQGNLTLNIADMTALVVQKAEDRSFLMGSHRSYTLRIELSEKGLETAEQSGLVFKEYVTSLPEGVVAYALGVGQKSPFDF